MEGCSSCTIITPQAATLGYFIEGNMTDKEVLETWLKLKKLIRGGYSPTLTIPTVHSIKNQSYLVQMVTKWEKAVRQI